MIPSNNAINNLSHIAYYASFIGKAFSIAPSYNYESHLDSSFFLQNLGVHS